MPYKVNDIPSFLQDFRQNHAEVRTFAGFLHDTPSLLRLAVGVQWGAVGNFAACFRLNRAEPGTLSPRGCCGVLSAGVCLGCGALSSGWQGWAAGAGVGLDVGARVY